MIAKRNFRRAVTAALGALMLVLGANTSAQADEPSLEAFSYRTWDAVVEIDVTKAGRAIAHVTESIVAEFPDTDQNRGMVRAIPQDFLGASTNPRDFSVTDEHGAPVPFEIEDGTDEEQDASFVAVLTGDDTFVHGAQTYVISYTLDDVILHRDDATADEFSWDLLPASRNQPVDAFTASVRFSPGLQAQLNGNARCYAGLADATTECDVRASAQDPAQLAIGPIKLAAREGVTVNIGLAPGSVVQPPIRLPNYTLDTLPLVLGGATLAVSGAGAIAVARLRSKRRSTAPVIAQYDVPDHLPPLIAGPIAGTTHPTPPAEIVHLALLGATRIEDAEQTGKKRSKEAQLAIRLVDPTRTADSLDGETVAELFPSPEVGSVFVVPQEDEKFGERMTALSTSGQEQALERGYFERVRSPLARTLGWISLGLVIPLVILMVMGFATRNSITPLICLAVVIVAGMFGLIGISKQRVLTPLGAETRNYLAGVKEFIRIAEADRIAMLQSVTGAERESAAALSLDESAEEQDNAAVIQLYERLLPYAMLFGLEKEWGKALQARYVEDPNYLPVWYPGLASGGLARLDSSISQFASSISSATSYSASSSGGSTGGGFVGGGGGGGFAGGR